MKKLSILLLLLSFTSKASTNYAIETLVRSFPIGAFAKYTVGKSALLWGDKKHKKDITYGFIRPELEFRTSGLVNYVGGRLSVYPLPILGLFTGSEIGTVPLPPIPQGPGSYARAEQEIVVRLKFQTPTRPL